MKVTYYCPCLALLLTNIAAYGQKTNEAVYNDAFDLAGGGASLTLANQQASVFANPAILPWGGEFYRWTGVQTSIIVEKSIRKFATKIASGGPTGSEEDLLNTVLNSKFHFGQSTIFSTITENFGLSIFSRIEPDLESMSHGTIGGTPAIAVQPGIYAGALVSAAGKISNWFSIGVTGKCLFSRDTPKEILISNSQEISKEIQDLQDPSNSLPSTCKPSTYDAGSLFFFPSSYFDLRIALKAEDLNGQNTNEAPFFPSYSAGLGFTLHGTVNALHLSFDVRDISSVYQEKKSKKIYLGAKLTIWQSLGLAVGLYQGYPSFGFRAEVGIPFLLAINIGLTGYSKDLGNFIGQKRRDIYIASLGFGI